MRYPGSSGRHGCCRYGSSQASGCCWFWTSARVPEAQGDFFWCTGPQLCGVCRCSGSPSVCRFCNPGPCQCPGNSRRCFEPRLSCVGGSYWSRIPAQEAPQGSKAKPRYSGAAAVPSRANRRGCTSFGEMLRGSDQGADGGRWLARAAGRQRATRHQGGHGLGAARAAGGGAGSSGAPQFWHPRGQCSADHCYDARRRRRRWPVHWRQSLRYPPSSSCWSRGCGH